MENTYNMQTNSVPFSPDQLENMYPDVYNDVFPLVMEAVDDMMRRGYTPTPELINTIVDNIIKSSGMWDEDDDTDQNIQAMPVQFGFGRQPFRRRRRRHHNRNTLRDTIRILLLRELFGRRGGFPR